jgi:uncharacterized damage-inducible protein DinB
VTLNTLTELLAHNDWGREKILAGCIDLPDTALDRPFEMGHGTLRNTLHHLWAAERVWLDRWLEKRDIRFVQPEPGLPLRELGERFRETAAERNAFFDRIGADGFRRRVTFTNTKGETYTFPIGDMALHVANHGSHHRAQALNMMRHVGATLPKPGLDYIFMRLEQPDPPLALESDTIAEYFRYADWARDRIHAVAGELTDAQLDRPFEMGVGTLRKTLLHIRFAEQWWLENWTLGPGRPFPELDEQSSIAELVRLFDQTARQRSQFIAGCRAADLLCPVSAHPRPGVVRTFPLGVTMLQLCGHGTHHRAQALNMLRHVGAQTPGLDYIVWLREAAPRLP